MTYCDSPHLKDTGRTLSAAGAVHTSSPMISAQYSAWLPVISLKHVETEPTCENENERAMACSLCTACHTAQTELKQNATMT